MVSYVVYTTQMADKYHFTSVFLKYIIKLNISLILT